jgi:ADP-ribose pyrophosphatase YjhB (NUDIX family)
LPGGGVDDEESLEVALKREMIEEAGAVVYDIEPIGCYDETRPTYYEGYDAMHMVTYI